MEASEQLKPSPGSKTSQRTESGHTIPRPGTPPPHPPGFLPAVRSNKKQRLNQIINLFQGHPVETYTEDLTQIKSPEADDLIWLSPTRMAKQEMNLSGILNDSPWILVTLTVPDEQKPAYPPTWLFTLLGMTRQAKVQLKPKDAWEYLSDWTSSEADKAWRDRLSAHNHVHNLFPYPRIMVIKGDLILM